MDKAAWGVVPGAYVQASIVDWARLETTTIISHRNAWLMRPSSDWLLLFGKYFGIVTVPRVF